MLTVRGKAVHLVEWKKHSCDEMEQKQETESGETCFCLSFASGWKIPCKLIYMHLKLFIFKAKWLNWVIPGVLFSSFFFYLWSRTKINIEFSFVANFFILIVNKLQILFIDMDLCFETWHTCRSVIILRHHIFILLMLTLFIDNVILLFMCKHCPQN